MNKHQDPRPCTYLAFIAGWLVVLGCCWPGASWADFNRTALLIDAPVAEVLPTGVLRFTAAGSQGLARSPLSPGAEGDFNIRFSPFNRLELAISAYTRYDYVLGATYQLLDGKGRAPSVAIGIHDIGIRNSVSSIGHDNSVWPDEQYPGKPDENFSAYAVTTVPVARIAALSLGLGRGRYVGYGNHSQFLNTDYLMTGHHQWAIGLFGGAQVNLGSHLSALAEVDGRDLNAGFKARFGTFEAGVALSKLEGLLWSQGNQFHRVSLGVSYQTASLFHPRATTHAPLPQFGALTGKVTDRKTGLPVPATITLVSGSAATDDHGNFLFDKLPAGKLEVTASADGYKSSSVVSELTPGATARLEIALEPELAELPLPPPQPLLAAAPAPQPALKLTSLDLAQVFFEFDKSELSPKAQSILREHAELLKANPGLTVTLQGRTCEIGTEEYNFQLGERRARTVYDYLLAQGVPARQLSYRSLGRTFAKPGQALSSCRRCDFTTEVEGK